MLNEIWFLLIGVLLAGYAVLDGFDLGIGVLLPFLARTDQEKRSLFQAIGPVWDGNEVWLLTGAGALFAAFPQAYATVFSGFYLALMLVLFSLILRAVSLEFWAQDVPRRGLWQWTFTVGSALPALLFGVALGNVVQGVPLNAAMEFTGNFFTLLRPWPLLVGLTGLFAFIVHGAAYAVIKTSGAVADRARSVLSRAWIGLLALVVLTAVVGVWQSPDWAGRPLAWAAGAAAVGSVLLVRYWAARGHANNTFWASSLVYIALWAVAGALHFPNLVRASNDPALSLTVTNNSGDRPTRPAPVLSIPRRPPCPGRPGR